MRILVQAIATALTANMDKDIPLPIPVDKLPDFVAGLINGLVDHNDLPELRKCLTGQEELEKDVAIVITDFKNKNIIGGIKELGTIITQEIPKDVALCVSLNDDIKRIEDWAKIFSHPFQLIEELVKNMGQHWDEIMTDNAKVLSDMESKQFFAMGDDISQILVALLGKPPKSGQNFEATSIQGNVYNNKEWAEFNSLDWDSLFKKDWDTYTFDDFQTEIKNLF